jgi:MFS family permease
MQSAHAGRWRKLVGHGKEPVTGARALTAWTTALLLMGVLPPYLIASLAVSMREDFAFSAGALGAAAGLSFAAAAVVSPIPGRMVHWLGLRRGVVLAASVVSASSLSLATWADSATDVILLMALHGAGSGIGTPTYSALLAREVPAERHGTAFGLLTSAPQMAVLAAGLALPLVAVPLNWRAAFVVPAVGSLVCLAALWRTGRLATPVGPAQEPPGWGWRSRAVRRLALATVLMSASGVGMRSFLVLFAISIGFSSSVGGVLLSATALLALVTRLGVGVLLDRRPGDPFARAAALMALCAAGFVLMAMGGAVAVVIGAVLAGGIGWGWQSPLTVALLGASGDAPGAALGLQLGGFYLGAVVGPPLVALLADQASYSVAWVGCCALTAVAACIALTARGGSRPR